MHDPRERRQGAVDTGQQAVDGRALGDIGGQDGHLGPGPQGGQGLFGVRPGALRRRQDQMAGALVDEVAGRLQAERAEDRR
ncbi:hypothetical protein Srubr_18150 [Streptomyces rubradiris]|uniref:Uncharacterized protein n=1 Tax=Streptomyces rubradiris TaxID=285531 RepID=A0ABQ3R7Z4_STRRR|nr:hypothetical protein Srubr_18150 [Streptomyces rubradiris]